VGRVQGSEGALPLALVHQVIPVRDQVAQRTAAVTERQAAVHTAGCLGPRIGLRPFFVKLQVSADAHLGVAAWRRLSYFVLKSGRFAQAPVSPSPYALALAAARRCCSSTRL